MIQEAIAQYLQKQRQVLFSPKAVLFDMDGVLYDSMRFHARAWYETATHHQLISTPEPALLKICQCALTPCSTLTFSDIVSILSI